MVNSVTNTICDISEQNSRRHEFCDIFSHTVVIRRKTVNKLRIRFVTLVHRTRGDMNFVTFLLIQ